MASFVIFTIIKLILIRNPFLKSLLFKIRNYIPLKKIHIGYGDSATGCLKEAIKVHGLPGDKAIPSRDDFTQGPISECDENMNTSQRQNYWKMIDAEVNFGMDVDLFYQESMVLLDQVMDCEVVIWQGDSSHDILASAWLITYLEHRTLNWSIIDLSRLSPEELNDGLPVVNLAMFSPEQVADLYKYKQKIGEAAQQMYRDLWVAMRQENGAYRIKNGNEILSVSEDYHDEYIFSQIPNEWTMAADVIDQVISNSSHTITDTTAEWRIRHLIRSSKVEFRGELIGMDKYSLKKA